METPEPFIVSKVYLYVMNIKDTLLTAAFELFLKYGIKSVSMDDISKKMGMSKKTIYTCILNKEELVTNVLEKHLAEDEKQIQIILKNSSNAIDEMVNIAEHVLAFLRQMTPSLLHDLKKYHPISWEKIEKKHFTFIHNTILKNLLRGQQEGIYRLDFDPEIVAKLYVYKSNCVVDEDNFSQSSNDRITLFKEMIMYHLYGIVSQKGHSLLTKYQKTVSTL